MKRLMLCLLVVLLSCTSWAGTVRVNVQDYQEVIWPRGNGLRVPMRTFSDAYPSRDHFAQLAIFVKAPDNSMLLVHAQEAAPITRQLWEMVRNDGTAPCMMGQWCLRVSFFGSSDPSVLQTRFFATDWRAPADFYKAWAARQDWYRGHGKLATGQLGHILSGATTHYTYYRDKLSGLVPVFAPRRVGVFMTQYRAQVFDVNYPDYTCSQTANCASWLQDLRDAGAIGLPYVNGALWDSTHASYATAKLCLDSTGNPLSYASTSLRYIDPRWSSWPQILYDAFAALTSTDGRMSEGVYLDVLTASNKLCYYNGVADHAAWVTGTKAILAKFDGQIVMTEGTAEPFFPFTDIAYIYPPNTDQASTIGLFGYLYHDVPNLHIVGMTATGQETAEECYRLQDRARNELYHHAVQHTSGSSCDILLQSESWLKYTATRWGAH